ncbi:phenylacetate--CoA ligase family protein [Pelotomaculum propionicicum]|mgnify:CR=1 FL=1|uniref:Phenylacetate-coenzyme A ligase n=1 Tax=Pelotomaculum propionicicum TaxID=258475 RepID=A0A4Y7RTV2_9FIRM|nr:AMP-binding protein [Pelotomaculum propionicicum]TEB12405.1 Phenylacetate-coenzyme A ligase [Pelotomaculum propionicicum]
MLMTGVSQTTGVDYKYWSPAEVMPRSELKKLQLARLTEQVNYLWEKSPFYREKWGQNGFNPGKLKTLDDIRCLPFLKKEEIRISQEIDPPYGMMRMPGRGPFIRIGMTSGTTGEPVLIPFTEEDYFGVFCEGAVRSVWAAGIRNHDIVHVAFGFTPFMGLAASYDSCEHLVGSLVIPGGTWSSMMRLRMIKKLGVTVLMGTPTYILHLAKVAQDNGIDPSTLGVKIICTGGEPGGMSIPNTGMRLEQAWGAKAFDFCGTQETNYIAWMCEEGTGHLNEDLVYCEVLDPETDEPVKPGESGKLVVTDLVGKTHPCIRFETGDIVGGIDEGFSCGCGRTLSKFKGFKGRVGDIIKIRGVCVSVAGIENVLRGIKECSDNYEYMALNNGTGMDKIKVRIEPQQNVDAALWDNVRKKVAEELQLSFMVNMDVEVVPPGTLPVYELKAKRFHDLR